MTFAWCVFQQFDFNLRWLIGLIGRMFWSRFAWVVFIFILQDFLDPPVEWRGIARSLLAMLKRVRSHEILFWAKSFNSFMLVNVAAQRLQNCWEFLVSLRIDIPRSMSLMLTVWWLIRNAITCFACGIPSLELFPLLNGEKSWSWKMPVPTKFVDSVGKQMFLSRMARWAILLVLYMVLMAVSSNM